MDIQTGDDFGEYWQRDGEMSTSKFRKGLQSEEAHDTAEASPGQTLAGAISLTY